MFTPNLTSVQRERLIEAIPYALNTAFYQRKITEELRDKDVDPYFRLSQLPYTYKQELRSIHPNERTCLPQQDILAYFSSSGSTGQPSVYAWSKLDQEVFNEISRRINQPLGVGPGDVALLAIPFGMPLSGFGMMMEMQAVGASFIPIGAVSLEQIAQALVNYPVTLMKINPIIASRLLRFIQINDSSILKKIRLKQIHLVGYPVSFARHRRLEEGWGVPCYRIYGMSEIGLLAGECGSRDGGQHLSADYVLTEIIDPITLECLPDGQVGVGIYTSLWKKGSPILRYWSDDFFSIKQERCSCGSNLPKLFFKGRKEDSIVIGGKRVFVSEIEDILFLDQKVGDDFELEVSETAGKDECTLIIEAVSSNNVPQKAIKILEDFLGVRVKLKSLSHWPSDRLVPKPTRLIEKRLGHKPL